MSDYKRIKYTNDFENIIDSGNEGTKVAAGSDAQRGTTAGQFRFNTDSNIAEYYDGTSWRQIDSPPSVGSISPSSLNSSALPANITVNGNFFDSNSTVTFIGNNGAEVGAASVTYVDDTELTVSVPATITSANEPWSVRVTKTSGLASVLSDALNINAAPIFNTASGSLGTLENNESAGNLTTISITEDEGEGITLTVVSGSIPSGLTLNNNGTFSGNAPLVGSNTTYSFTVRASDGTNTADRAFTITVNAPPYLDGSGGNNTYTYGDYRVHAFTGAGTFTVNTLGADPTYGSAVDVLLVGGGGAGGNDNSAGGGAGGLVYRPSLTVSATGYGIVIGGGNTNPARFPSNDNTYRGGDTTGFGLTAKGGGNGGGDDAPGIDGGSGGGGADNPSMNGGSGYQTSQPGDSGTYGFGNRGGNTDGFNNDGGCGGGGAGARGRDMGDSPGHDGGVGRDYSGTFGTTYGESGWFAGGGGGGYRCVTSPCPPVGSGPGGQGQGGTGGGGDANSVQAGATNTGGGGAGRNGGGAGGNGGSGICLVRYKIQ